MRVFAKPLSQAGVARGDSACHTIDRRLQSQKRRMKRTAQEKNPPESARLSRDDWLDAAFDAVVEGGFDSVRVLLLADRLGVTRGSFYWHFKDHADLVDSLIRRWHQSEIETDRQLGEIRSDDPGADLMQILDVALARGSGDLKEMRFELALRGQGRRDPVVARYLVEVDDQRMELFETQFMRLTGEPQKATELAVLFYLAITGGVQALSRPSSTQRIAEYIKGVIADHVIHQHAPPPPGH